MSNVESYETKYKTFQWKQSEDELGFGKNGDYNIGFFCSDRICELGSGDKTALIWEGFTGEVKKFTFDDIRTYSNSFALMLRALGMEPGDRVCIFMDRIPELYISFLGILKMGAIVQPLFSAFGEDALHMRLEDAKTKAILTTRKHLGKVRRIRERLPDLKNIIVVDAGDKSLERGETAFSMERQPHNVQFDVVKVKPDTPSVLHYTSGTTGKPKGALHVHSSLVAQYMSTKWVLDLTPNDIYW